MPLNSLAPKFVSRIEGCRRDLFHWKVDLSNAESSRKRERELAPTRREEADGKSEEARRLDIYNKKWRRVSCFSR